VPIAQHPAHQPQSVMDSTKAETGKAENLDKVENQHDKAAHKIIEKFLEDTAVRTQTALNEMTKTELGHILINLGLDKLMVENERFDRYRRIQLILELQEPEIPIAHSHGSAKSEAPPSHHLLSCLGAANKVISVLDRSKRLALVRAFVRQHKGERNILKR